jgi:uroporphyrin-III C-methyltransferase/precorrin-2 dehydrogenase/sirohydrochlorin ferrochelatase
MTARRQARRQSVRRRGIVSLVGAGPGDPALLTTRAIERLKAADLVLYDGLVPRAIVNLAPHAERESVARRAGTKRLTQADVSARMIAAARQGQRVVRLKSGDPFVFARGGEELAALAKAGITAEVVPGVSSALAAPALAGIPMTHRGVSSAFIVLSGHAPERYEPLLGALPAGGATIVVLMGLARRRAIGRCLMAAGWPANTPVAIVMRASQPSQHVWTGTLARLGVKDGFNRRHRPGVMVIGEVVREASRPRTARRA